MLNSEAAAGPAAAPTGAPTVRLPPPVSYGYRDTFDDDALRRANPYYLGQPAAPAPEYTSLVAEESEGYVRGALSYTTGKARELKESLGAVGPTGVVAAVGGATAGAVLAGPLRAAAGAKSGAAMVAAGAALGSTATQAYEKVSEQVGHVSDLVPNSLVPSVLRRDGKKAPEGAPGSSSSSSS